jgi:GAF domain-containing protein
LAPRTLLSRHPEALVVSDLKVRAPGQGRQSHALDKRAPCAAVMAATPVVAAAVAAAAACARFAGVDLGTCLPSSDRLWPAVVPRPQEDIRFKNYPVVTGWPFVRFYAAAPLLAPGGQRLGTLCILDYKPRTFSAENAQLLAQLSGMVMREVERKVGWGGDGGWGRRVGAEGGGVPWAGPWEGFWP